MTDIKQKLYEACLRFVENRFKTIKNTITSYQEALASETKSSAGDKHETGRAMLQLEIEKAGQQLVSAKAMQETLAKINLAKLGKRIGLGSLVVTDKATYFLAISLGIITVDKTDFTVISLQSPLGRDLFGKGVGDEILFNKSKIVALY
jgi:transcription elongation GreA/GreB family factor